MVWQKGSGVDPHLEWTAALRGDPDDLELAPGLVLQTCVLECSGPAVGVPVRQAAAVGLVGGPLALLASLFLAHLLRGVLRPDGPAVEALSLRHRPQRKVIDDAVAWFDVDNEKYTSEATKAALDLQEKQGIKVVNFGPQFKKLAGRVHP